MDCTRKHTLVTGCSSGIGRATALRLAAAGQHVYAGVRNLGDGVQLARSAAGGELTPVILDVTDASHIAAATAAIVEHTTAAGLDGLVNNAGFGLACPAELVQLDAFRRQLEVNVTGQLAVTQAFLPSLRRARGRIVMVSTIGVRFTPPFAGPLDATKAALAALGDTLRQELAPWGGREMMAEFGRLLWQAMRCGGRALRDLYGDLEQASECYWLSSRAAVPRSGPMVWVPSLDGYRLVGSHLPEPGPPADTRSSPQP